MAPNYSFLLLVGGAKNVIGTRGIPSASFLGSVFGTRRIKPKSADFSGEAPKRGHGHAGAKGVENGNAS